MKYGFHFNIDGRGNPEIIPEMVVFTLFFRECGIVMDSIGNFKSGALASVKSSPIYYMKEFAYHIAIYFCTDSAVLFDGCAVVYGLSTM